SGLNHIQVFNLAVEITLVVRAHAEGVGLHEDLQECEEKVQVLGRWPQAEGVDRERPLLEADWQIGAAKEQGDVFVAAAKVKDAGDRLVLLQVCQEEIQQKTFAAARRAEDGGVSDVLVVEIEKVRRADLCFEDRQVFRSDVRVLALTCIQRVRKRQIRVVG